MLVSFVSVLYLLLFTGNQIQYVSGTPVIMGYEYIQDLDLWLRLHIEPATWEDARLRCHLEGGILTSPTNSTMISEMLRMTAGHHMALTRIFTGINAVVAKGHFMTIDGIPVGNCPAQWAKGEPNNVNNDEDCVVMTGAGELADVPCSDVHPFICQKRNERMIVNKCGTTADGYRMEPRTGSCYKLHLVPRTWHQAAAACSAEGAHLTVINSPTESQVLKEIFAQHPDNVPLANPNNAMIGFWDWNEHKRNSEWLTIFGETLSEAGFNVWSNNEPSGGEFCGSILRDGLLNDFPCDSSLALFICEINPNFHF